jgi:hypothetical protein
MTFSRSGVKVNAAMATSREPSVTPSMRPRRSVSRNSKARFSCAAMSRQRSMLIPVQAPSAAFMEKGGASFVPTTRVRPWGTFFSAASAWETRTIASPAATMSLQAGFIKAPFPLFRLLEDAARDQPPVPDPENNSCLRGVCSLCGFSSSSLIPSLRFFT